MLDLKPEGFVPYGRIYQTMKETEFETALYASIEEMKEEFKVVKNALDIEKEVNANNNKSIKKLKDQVQKLQKDLELENPRYGSDSTRKIARDAFNQSTVSANWQGLEEHPFIETICKTMKKYKDTSEHRFGYLMDKLGKIPTFKEVSEDLRNTDVITTIMARLADADSFAQTLGGDVDNDRRHGNQQDLKLRDKIADVMTAQDALEFIQAETIHTYDTAMIFVMGAFATMKYKPVADGLREILKKPKGKK